MVKMIGLGLAVLGVLIGAIAWFVFNSIAFTVVGVFFVIIGVIALIVG